MKITILNGNSDPANTTFDEYLGRLAGELRGQGSPVELFTLREMKLHFCAGCFGCWIKTPGECISQDEGPAVCRASIQADFLLWAAPLRMGYPDALLKKVMDKSLPLIHPYAAVVNGEAHHRARYDRYPACGLLVQPEADSDAADLKIVSDMFRRTALNFKTFLAFARTTAFPVEDTARLILAGRREWAGLPALPAAASGARIQPPSRITFFNGSPRGSKGNTPIMLEHFHRGFSGPAALPIKIHHLAHQSARASHLEAFASAECAWLGFPLYTDAMPGLVKAFIDALEPLKGRKGNPPVGFLVQSGFPESAHSRFVERYLEKLASRLGSAYLGTIVRGGGEGTRLMPDEMNRKLFEALEGLGRDFAAEGRLDPVLLKTAAGVERFPLIAAPLFTVLSKIGLLDKYWDDQLKRNGVYERRFARPYA